MKASLLLKLEHVQRRHQELAALLSDPAVISDQNKFRDLSKEYAQLQPIVDTLSRYQSIQEDLRAATEMLDAEDASMHDYAKEEMLTLTAESQAVSEQLQLQLIPKDPDDDKNVFLEIRAGTGGDEAALFVGDLLRMYLRYAETQRWQRDMISASESEQGGYKEVVVRLSGGGVYGQLKFESGAHRVQRVPATESQGRVHTSACTVAVMPEADELTDIDINPSDLRIDTFRASGAGGQHVNKTDSAIRITHLPSGVVVECQDERSQHKNKARALSLLQSKLHDQQKQEQAQAQASLRKGLVGSGDRSERIRTYNFPQGRVTDHRINLTLYQLDDIMAGDLSVLIQPLMQEAQAEQLAALGDE